MMPLMLIISLQVVIALIVVFVLIRVLDRELETVALEKISSLQHSDQIKTISVYYAKTLPLNVRNRLTSTIKNKFSNAVLSFVELKDLKAGMMVKLDEEVLDFSLSSRLENFWS